MAVGHGEADPGHDEENGVAQQMVELLQFVHIAVLRIRAGAENEERLCPDNLFQACGFPDLDRLIDGLAVHP